MNNANETRACPLSRPAGALAFPAGSVAGAAGLQHPIVPPPEIAERWQSSLHEAAHAIVARIHDVSVGGVIVHRDGGRCFHGRTRPYVAAIVAAAGEPGGLLDARFDPPMADLAGEMCLPEGDPLTVYPARMAEIERKYAGQLCHNTDDRIILRWVNRALGFAAWSRRLDFVCRRAAELVRANELTIVALARELFLRGAIVGDELANTLAPARPRSCGV